jgi:hypothetical protein
MRGRDRKVKVKVKVKAKVEMELNMKYSCTQATSTILPDGPYLQQEARLKGSAFIRMDLTILASACCIFQAFSRPDYNPKRLVRGAPVRRMYRNSSYLNIS